MRDFGDVSILQLISRSEELKKVDATKVAAGGVS